MASGEIPFEDRIAYEPMSGCWLWCYANTQGYGKIHDNGRPVRAHRYAWEKYRGPIPDGMWVLHKCDTPPCVNPDHLFLGTPQDNTQDALNKGRSRGGSSPGETNPRAYLTWDKVRAIRAAHAAAEFQGSAGVRRKYGLLNELARQFGTNRGNIENIVHNRSWKET